MAELPPGYKAVMPGTEYGVKPLPPGFTRLTDMKPQMPEYSGGAGYNTARAFLYEESLAKLAQMKNPGSTIEEKDGTWYIDIPGQPRQAINAPGGSASDLYQAGGAAALTVGTMGLGSLAAKTLLPKAGAAAVNAFFKSKTGAGLITAGESAGRDAAGDMAVGEDVDVNLGRTAMEGLGGAGGQLAANAGTTFLGKHLGRRANYATRKFDPRIKLSDANARKLKAAGVDVSVITDEQAQLINRNAPMYKGYDDAAAGRALYLDSQKIRPTVGSMTQNPSDQMSEDLLSKGKYGAAAQADMQMLEEASGRRVGEIADDLAPPGPGVAGAQAELIKEQNLQKGGFNALFQGIRNRGANTAVQEDVAGALREEVTERVVRATSIEDAAILMDDFPDAINGEVNLQSLMGWMQKVSKRGAPGQIATQSLMDGMDEAAGMMLMRGDPTAIADLRAVREAYRGFSKQWNAKDLFSRLIATDTQGALKVPPEEATNFLLGASDAGWTTKAGLNGALMKIKAEMGGTVQWTELRNAIGRRMIGGSAISESVDTGATRFSGGMMRKQFDKAMKNRGETMKLLFSPDELAEMDNFTRMASWLSRKAGSGGALNSTTTLGLSSSGLSHIADSTLPKGMSRLIPFLHAAEGALDAGVQRHTATNAVNRALNPAFRGAAPRIMGAGPVMNEAWSPLLQDFKNGNTTIPFINNLQDENGELKIPFLGD